jgi:hypothetical protein
MISPAKCWLKEVVFLPYHPLARKTRRLPMAFQEKIPEISGSAQSTSLLFLQQLDRFVIAAFMGKSMRIHHLLIDDFPIEISIYV